MGELTIRRNTPAPAARYQGVGKAEKTAGSTSGQGVSKLSSQPAAEALHQTRTGQADSQSMDSRRTLQTGEGVLAEVQDRLGRLGELARQAAQGGDPAALQAELEGLRDEIGRMLRSADADGTPLFPDGEDGAQALPSAGEEVPGGSLTALPGWLTLGLLQDSRTPEELLSALGLDGSAGPEQILAALADRPLDSSPAAARLAALYLGAVIAGGGRPENVTQEQAQAGLHLLLEKVADGMSPDQAVELLTGGTFTGFSDFQTQFTGGTAPGLSEFLSALLLSGESAPPVLSNPSLLPLLAGLQNTNLELMMDLLTALQPGQADEAAARSGAHSPEAASTAGPAAAREAQPGSAQPQAVQTAQLGGVQVTGRDLSGVSLDPATGALTVDGGADVTLRGTQQAGQAIVVRGSGAVTLQDVNASTITVDSPQARILTAGENTVGQVLLGRGVSLTLDGQGLVKIGSLHGDHTTALRLAGGAVVLEEDPPEAQRVQLMVDGGASLAARSVPVADFSGRPLEPFDLVWKALLPGWGGLSSIAVDGKQAHMALAGGENPDPARLWLLRGDQGYPAHTLVFRGRDPSGRPQTRYAYLLWNQRTAGFEEVDMYPNPFTVTGGEPGLDWVYEEESHTLRILSAQVSAVSGGPGTDANQAHFSGRIALADAIGPIRLTLDGVVCRVASGQAFHLGQENEVTLLLQCGTRNRFDSGEGCAGISLGSGTALSIDCAPPPKGKRSTAGTLTASGKDGGAGIGRDSGQGRERTGSIQILGGVITASGDGGGAGIGAGRRGSMGTITISGGTITSTGGTGGGAGIGGGLAAPVGDIQIEGGNITAAALYHAAAIGAGVQGSCGDILITGSARILKALGGSPGADIGACLFGTCGAVRVSGGADIGKAKLWTQAGIPLQMGEDTVVLPQFPLSARSLGLDTLSVETPERARAAQRTVEADCRWIAQIQSAYGALHGQLERSIHRLRSVQQYTPADDAPLRSTDTAGALLEDMRHSLLRQPGQAARSHARRTTGDVEQLLR